jgi:hypothetical protein
MKHVRSSTGSVRRGSPQFALSEFDDRAEVRFFGEIAAISVYPAPLIKRPNKASGETASPRQTPVDFGRTK